MKSVAQHPSRPRQLHPLQVAVASKTTRLSFHLPAVFVFDAEPWSAVARHRPPFNWNNDVKSPAVGRRSIDSRGDGSWTSRVAISSDLRAVSSHRTPGQLHPLQVAVASKTTRSAFHLLAILFSMPNPGVLWLDTAFLSIGKTASNNQKPFIEQPTPVATVLGLR